MSRRGAGAVCPCGALTHRPSKRCASCEEVLAQKRVTRRSVYDDPRWRQTRTLAMYRDHWTCADCGHVDWENLGSTLDGHHEPDVDELLARGLDPFDARYVVTLCRRCHGRRGGQRLRR